MDAARFVIVVSALFLAIVVWLIIHRYFVEAVLATIVWAILIALWLPAVPPAL